MSFKERVIEAAETGIVWGVKLALALALVLIGVSYVLGDYAIVRERALNGQRAFEFIQQQMKEAKP